MGNTTPNVTDVRLLRMARQLTLNLDLTGMAGLTERYYGDKPYAAANPNLRYLGKDGQMADGIYNPISLLGFLSPANNTAKAVTGTTNFLLTSAVLVPVQLTAGTTNAIFFADEATTGTQGQILNLDTAVDTSLANKYTLPLFGTPSQYAKSVDFALYQINGIQKIFFTRTNTTTHSFVDTIGIATYSFATPAEDWSAVTPAGADTTLLIDTRGRMFFCLADNGFLYVLNGHTVHKIDGTKATGGTNGTITPEVLVFLGAPSSSGTSNPITTLVDAVDLRGKMWIGLHVNGKVDYEATPMDAYLFNQYVGVYIWDRRTTVVSMQDFVAIAGVRELKSMHIFQGQPACFTISTEGYTELRTYNGREFQLVKTLGKNAYPTHRKHSVVEAGDMIYWLGNDGIVYAYGKLEPSLSGNALYKIGDMTTQVTNATTYSGSGVMIAANAAESVTSGYNTIPLAFYISFKDTGGNHLIKWYPHAYDPASTSQKAHTGTIYSLVKLMPKLSDIHGITLFFPAIGSGGSTDLLDVKIYLNQSSSATATYTLNQDDAARGWKFMPLEKNNINAVQLSFAWKAQNLAGNITPYAAEINYSPTSKRL